jgi:hypothetical protein
LKKCAVRESGVVSRATKVKRVPGFESAGVKKGRCGVCDHATLQSDRALTVQ